MFLAMETPFKLGAQLKRPNQGYAVDNLRNNFTFNIPVKHGLLTKNHKRLCTFPSIKKNLPLRQMLLQDHFSKGKQFLYSLEGKKITCANKWGAPETCYELHKKTQSMRLFNRITLTVLLTIYFKLNIFFL